MQQRIIVLETLLESYQNESDTIEKYISLQQKRLQQLRQEKEKVDQEFSKTQGKTNRVFYYRVIEGLTQEKTAEKLGMSSRQIQRIEKNYKKDIK